MQNAFIEKTNGSIRREVLNVCQFTTMNEVRELCEQWREDYNTERPHKGLGYLSPLLLLKNGVEVPLVQIIFIRKRRLEITQILKEAVWRIKTKKKILT